MPTRDEWRAEALRRVKKDGALSTFELEANHALANAVTELIASGELVSLPSAYPILKLQIAAKEHQ